MNEIIWQDTELFSVALYKRKVVGLVAASDAVPEFWMAYIYYPVTYADAYYLSKKEEAKKLVEQFALLEISK